MQTNLGRVVPKFLKIVCRQKQKNSKLFLIPKPSAESEKHILTTRDRCKVHFTDVCLQGYTNYKVTVTKSGEGGTPPKPICLFTGLRAQVHYLVYIKCILRFVKSTSGFYTNDQSSSIFLKVTEKYQFSWISVKTRSIRCSIFCQQIGRRIVLTPMLFSY